MSDPHVEAVLFVCAFHNASFSLFGFRIVLVPPNADSLFKVQKVYVHVRTAADKTLLLRSGSNNTGGCLERTPASCFPSLGRAYSGKSKLQSVSTSVVGYASALSS